MQGLVPLKDCHLDRSDEDAGFRGWCTNDELSGVTADSLPTGRVPSSSKDSSLCPSLMSEPQRPFTEEGLGSLCLRKGLVWWVPTGPGPLPCLASHSHLDRTMGGRRTLASIVGHCEADQGRHAAVPLHKCALAAEAQMCCGSREAQMHRGFGRQ